MREGGSQSIELDDGIVGQRGVQLRSKAIEGFVCRGSGFVSQLRAQSRSCGNSGFRTIRPQRKDDSPPSESWKERLKVG